MNQKTTSTGSQSSFSAEVLVHGSGWVAQTAALALDDIGLKVALTQAPQKRPALADHRAMALNASSRALLQRLRAWPEAQACPVTAMRVQDGPATLSFSAEETRDEALTWIVPGAALSAALSGALAQRPRLQTVPAETQFSQTPAQLHVICEGGAGLLGMAGAQPLAYGQHAIAAVLALAEPHQNTARQWFANGEVLALLPLHDEAEQHRAALVWSVSDTRAQSLMQLDEAAFCQALAEAAGLSRPPALLSPRQTWPLAAAQSEQWLGVTDGQAWVLAGDSAHRVHPLAGLGLNLGLGDVASLAQHLAQRQGNAYWRKLSDPALLKPYMRERQSKAAQVFAATEGLFQLQQPRKASTSAWGASALAAAASAWPTLRQAGMRAVQASPALKRQLVKQAMQ